MRARVRNFVGLRFWKFRVLFCVIFGSWDPLITLQTMSWTDEVILPVALFLSFLGVEESLLTLEVGE